MRKKYEKPVAKMIITEELCDSYWEPGWSWQNPSGTWHQKGGWAKQAGSQFGEEFEEEEGENNPIWE